MLKTLKILKQIKGLKNLKRFTRISVIVALIIGSFVSATMTIHHYNVVMIDYIIADDCSYVVYTYDEEKVFSPIEKLPNSIDEEFGGLLRNARLESDKSKRATCYEYEYNGLIYLKAEISDNKFIVFGEDTSIEIFYYVENK